VPLTPHLHPHLHPHCTHTAPTLHPHCTHTYMHTQPPPIKQVLREAFLPGAAAAAVYLFVCNLHHIARWIS